MVKEPDRACSVPCLMEQPTMMSQCMRGRMVASRCGIVDTGVLVRTIPVDTWEYKAW